MIRHGRLPVGIGKMLFAAAILFVLAGDGFASESLELTLKDAVSAALKANLSIQEQNILSMAGEADVTSAEGEFDPAFGAGLSASFEKTQAATLIASPEQRAFGYSLSLGGKIKTGTNYRVEWSSERIKRGETQFLLLNPTYSTGLSLSVAQPLLKGRGRDVQESSLRVAEGNLNIARLRAKQRAMEVINEAVGAYWNLYFARDNLKVVELSLNLAENLLEEVKAKVEAGLFAPVEVYNAEAEAAVRQEGLLTAKKSVSDAEDALRMVMNSDDWQREITPVDVPGEQAGTAPDVYERIDTALTERQDYRQAIADFENKKILSAFYKNQRLPDVSLTAGAGLNGLDGGYGDSLESTTSGDFYSWQVGVSLSLPLGNRAAEGRYSRSKHEEEAAKVGLDALRQKITVEVREAVRAVALASESIAATQKTRTASEKRLQAEEARFRLGMATLNDVLRFQEEYTRALSSEKRAHTDYEKAVVNLERVSGTLSAE